MVHQYKLNGCNIAVDVNSGYIHVVDELAYDIIEMMGKGMTQMEMEPILIERYVDKKKIFEIDVQGALAEVMELKLHGKLFTKDKFEKLAEKMQSTPRNLKALCLHVAHTCNLNCSYCFASQGKYQGERALMSYEVGKRAIDFLIENSGKHRNLDVDFFGGEPLMNFEVVKQIVAYARSIEKKSKKHFRFTLTTNGVLLDDDVIEFANREMDNVVLSLDGRKEVHDKYRVDYAGNGSFDKIVPKFQKFVEARGDKDYYIRGTYTHSNPDFLNDIKAMLDLGFNKLSLEPVVCKKEDKEALTDEDIEIALDQYEKLGVFMYKRYDQNKDFTFYHYMMDLRNGPCIYKRISGCGSGTEYAAVTPWGDLYPCHQFVGDEKYKLGDIYNGISNTRAQEEFASCNVYTREECRDCWARLFCAGGCAANSYHATGSVKGVYEPGCRLFKKRLECAIVLEATKTYDLYTNPILD